MASESSQLAPEVYDQALQKLEALVDSVIKSQGSAVRLKKAELNLLAQVEVAHRLMSEALRAQNHRLVLEGIFGGSCVRISRTRAVLEVARLSDTNSHDQRLHDCLSACESVEQVLQDLGFGYNLRQSLEEHRILVKQRFVGDGAPCCHGELDMTVHQKMLKPTLTEEKPFVSTGNSPTSSQSCEEELEAGMIVIDLTGDRELFLNENVPSRPETGLHEDLSPETSVNPPEPKKDLHIQVEPPKSPERGTKAFSPPEKELTAGEVVILEQPLTSERESISSPKEPLARVERAPGSPMGDGFVPTSPRNMEHGRYSLLVPAPSTMPQKSRSTSQLLQLPVGSVTPWISPRSASNSQTFENRVILTGTCVGAQYTPRELPKSMSTKEFVTHGVVSSPMHMSVSGLVCVSPHRFHSPSRFHSPRASLATSQKSIAVPVEVVRQESMPKSPMASPRALGHRGISPVQEPMMAGAQSWKPVQYLY